jgi:hypothetical protein
MTVELRERLDEDVAPVQSVIERAEDYYERVHGHPPGPAEAHSVFMFIPEGPTSYEDKLLLGAFDEDGPLVGFVDAARETGRSPERLGERQRTRPQPPSFPP